MQQGPGQGREVQDLLTIGELFKVNRAISDDSSAEFCQDGVSVLLDAEQNSDFAAGIFAVVINLIAYLDGLSPEIVHVIWSSF
jgi:hypothetical protein